MKKHSKVKKQKPTANWKNSSQVQRVVLNNIIKNKKIMKTKKTNTEVMNQNQSTPEEKMEVSTSATIEASESKASMEQVLHDLKSEKLVDFSAIGKNGGKPAFVKELLERKDEYIKTLKESIDRNKAVLTPIEVLPALQMKDFTLVDKDGNSIPEADIAHTLVITSGEQNVLAYLEYTEANPGENVSCKMYHAQVPENMSIRDFLVEKGLLAKAPTKKDIENMIQLRFPSEVTTIQKCREVKEEINLPISVIYETWGKKRPSLKELRDALQKESLPEEIKFDTDQLDTGKKLLEALKIGVRKYPVLYKPAVETFREIPVDTSLDTTEENPYNIFLKLLKDEKLKSIFQTEDESSRKELFKTEYAEFSAKYAENPDSYKSDAQQATKNFKERKKGTGKKTSQPKPATREVETQQA